ncbi:MAG: exodeoxyribonuclease VII large subunit [Actinobacteria bacterium]|nr:exodeoxyribonuclease VII large subunit [Actinomycetota bacterium]
MSFGAEPQQAVQVHEVLSRLKDVIKNLPAVWVEGQLSEVNERSNVTFAKFRDLNAEASISIMSPRSALGEDIKYLVEGSHVLLKVLPEIWPRRGELQWRVQAIRPVGLGELLARLEALKQLLAAEGLFDAKRKKSLPFLPRKVGLICGRDSDAKHDVIVNAQSRWPLIEFAVKEVAVQGANAVKEVAAAIKELAADDEVDVIVIARGGGSLEDLLPFSDEGLIRLVASINKPIVSAIGHEQDNPLLDYVADVRASTPTDAARKIVPSLIEEIDLIKNLQRRLSREIFSIIRDEQASLFELQHNLLPLHPKTQLLQAKQWLNDQRYLVRSFIKQELSDARTFISTSTATIKALSPQGTLDRGYAIVRTKSDQLVTKPPKSGTGLSIRVAGGEFPAVSGKQADS